LGGELQETPEKATTSVPKQTDVVNLQQPEPTKQTTSMEYNIGHYTVKTDKNYIL